jgi:hypothetical protein
MPVETAADLAGMFNADEFAEPARYQAPGGGGFTPCTVVVDRGQGRASFDAGRSEASGSERTLMAQRGELAALARGGRFEILDADGDPTGEAFTIAGEPKLDQLGTLWACELLIAD